MRSVRAALSLFPPDHGLPTLQEVEEVKAQQLDKAEPHKLDAIRRGLCILKKFHHADREVSRSLGGSNRTVRAALYMTVRMCPLSRSCWTA